MKRRKDYLSENFSCAAAPTRASNARPTKPDVKADAAASKKTSTPASSVKSEYDQFLSDRMWRLALDEYPRRHRSSYRSGVTSG